jgi:hypothetical protein
LRVSVFLSERFFYLFEEFAHIRIIREGDQGVLKLVAVEVQIPERDGQTRGAASVIEKPLIAIFVG